MSYTPPDPCGSVEFSLSGTYTVPLPCDVIIFSTGEVTALVISTYTGNISITGSEVIIYGGQESNLPNKTSPGMRLLWKQTSVKVEPNKNSTWNKASLEDTTNRISWGDQEVADISLDIPVTNTVKEDKSYRNSWSYFPELKDKLTNFNFIGKLLYQDVLTRIKWGIFETLSDHTIDFLQNFLIPYDVTYDILWGGNEYPNRVFKHSFGTGEKVDKHHGVYWGPYWYSLWCQIHYWPPNDGFGIPFRLQEEIIAGWCRDIDLYVGFDTNVRCPFQHKHSGVRDKYIEVPVPPPLQIALSAWFYYMLNTITVKLLPDTPIDCFSVDIQTDIDSWCWDFSIAIPQKSFLDLVAPSLSGEDIVLKEIEISINHWKWRCMVESWSESISFGQRSWTIRGRSPSIELSSPYCLPSSFTNSSISQGGELVGDILNLTDWEVEWGFTNLASEYSGYLNPVTDWEIPATAFSYAEKTKLQAIQQVLEAIDGRIITKHNCDSSRRLIVIPRYRWTPWKWTTEEVTMDHLIHENACYEIGRSYNSLPRINNVVVSGETFGGIINAVKDGSAGDKAAPMFTNSLMTSVNACGEKAKNILSQSGMWTNHSIRLFSLDNFLAPTGYYPGVILPGKLISLTEGLVNKKGQVVSTSIHGESISGSNGVEVYQTIEVEEFNG